MKINSVLGKMTGKVGNIVLSSVGGKVVGREYNPNVANPNTKPQQNTRGKFKLASQLSASMAPVIAIKKEGNVSARNLFVKENFPAIRYSQGVADINLNVVQLTKSQRSFVGFNADRSSGSAIIVELNDSAASALSRVVYIAYKKAADGSLIFFDSKVCSTAGDNGKFHDVLNYTADAVVLYAYGMKDLEAGITSKFGNMSAPSAEEVAQLLVSNTENMSSVQLTKTAGLTMAAGENTGDSDDVEHLTVSLVISGNGSAVGGGRFETGQKATLRATPDEEATFVAWKANNASGQVLSTQNPYTFTVEQNMTICAVFQGGPTPHYNINLSADPANGGTVSGGGSKEEGSSCTVVAAPAEGMMFNGWFENGTLVSNSASYTFKVERARTLVAEFGEAPEGMIRSVKKNGADIVANQMLLRDTAYVGAFEASANGKTFAIVNSATVPVIGSAYSTNGNATIVSGAASVTPQDNQGTGKAYFVVGTFANSQITIDEVFSVSQTLYGGD